jgi:hypothetical protein
MIFKEDISEKLASELFEDKDKTLEFIEKLNGKMVLFVQNVAILITVRAKLLLQEGVPVAKKKNRPLLTLYFTILNFL